MLKHHVILILLACLRLSILFQLSHQAHKFQNDVNKFKLYVLVFSKTCSKNSNFKNNRTGFFVHRRLVSAVKRIEFVSDRLSYIVLRGRWLHIILVNMHAPSEEKSEELKDSFYEELEEVFDHIPKYHMKILLGDFNAKVGREDIFKPIIGQESLHQDSNDKGVRIVKFATSKNLVVKSTMFPHRNIHKYTWTSPDGKTHNQIDHVLIDRRWQSSALDVRSFRGAECDTDHCKG